MMTTDDPDSALSLEPTDGGRVVAEQPPLFEITNDGRLRPRLALMAELTPTASLEVARWWFRRELEITGHPPNTVESYCYDQNLIGPKPINRITVRDVGHFLDQSRTRSTRKRRLTSVGSFFDFLIKKAKVLTADPSDGFVPEHIPLKTPNPLFDNEQEALLAAAADEVRPGGTLVYSTCTISPPENAEQVERFLETRPDFAADDLGADWPDLRDRSRPRYLQTLPHRDATAGFFIARLGRTGESEPPA